MADLAAGKLHTDARVGFLEMDSVLERAEHLLSALSKVNVSEKWPEVLSHFRTLSQLLSLLGRELELPTIRMWRHWIVFPIKPSEPPHPPTSEMLRTRLDFEMEEHEKVLLEEIAEDSDAYFGHMAVNDRISNLQRKIDVFNQTLELASNNYSEILDSNQRNKVAAPVKPPDNKANAIATQLHHGINFRFSQQAPSAAGGAVGGPAVGLDIKNLNPGPGGAAGSTGPPLKKAKVSGGP